MLWELVNKWHNLEYNPLIWSINIRKLPDRELPLLGYFLREDLLLQVELSDELVSPTDVLTVIPGVAWCQDYSVLAPKWSTLAPALSFYAVVLPRYRFSAQQDREAGSGQS
jgi:hypothetical protein